MASFYLAVAPDHLGAHPRGDLRRPRRVRWLHCPLTLLENDLHQRAGEAGYRDGFIAHYLVKVIYPPGLTHGMQVGLGVLLLLVAVIGYWGFLRRRGRASLGRGSRPEHGTRTATSGQVWL